MKLSLSNYLTILGFVILGVVNHFQLKFKVIELESALKVSTVEMKLHIVKEINKLKTELKKENIAFRK